MSLKDDIERGHAIANHVYGSHELGATTRHLAIQDANAVQNLAVACEQLAAELKELREFVGAMQPLFEQIGGFMNTRSPCSCWGVIPQQCGRCILLEKIMSFTTGTDPFDAWRKMNAGEDESR